MIKLERTSNRFIMREAEQSAWLNRNFSTCCSDFDLVSRKCHRHTLSFSFRTYINMYARLGHSFFSYSLYIWHSSLVYLPPDFHARGPAFSSLVYIIEHNDNNKTVLETFVFFHLCDFDIYCETPILFMVTKLYLTSTLYFNYDSFKQINLDIKKKNVFFIQLTARNRCSSFSFLRCLLL